MKINDKATLCQTLTTLGIEYDVADTVNGLKITSRYNVQADVDILLKADHKGNSMIAVGFKKNEDGSYEAVGDFYEMRGCVTKENERLTQDSFKDAVSKRYTYHKAINQLTQLNFAMQTDVNDFSQQQLQFTMTSSF